MCKTCIKNVEEVIELPGVRAVATDTHCLCECRTLERVTTSRGSLDKCIDCKHFHDSAHGHPPPK